MCINPLRKKTIATVADLGFVSLSCRTRMRSNLPLFNVSISSVLFGGLLGRFCSETPYCRRTSNTTSKSSVNHKSSTNSHKHRKSTSDCVRSTSKAYSRVSATKCGVGGHSTTRRIPLGHHQTPHNARHRPRCLEPSGLDIATSDFPRAQ